LIAGRESLFNIVFSAYEFARLAFYDMKLKNCAPSDARVATHNAGRKGPTNGNTNGNREGDGHSQLVYKHAISTIMPASPITMFEAVDEEGR
jgi:hypothetical protein